MVATKHRHHVREEAQRRQSQFVFFMEGGLAEVLGHLQRRQGVKKQSQHYDGLAGNESGKNYSTTEKREKRINFVPNGTAGDGKNRLTYCWTQRNRERRVRRFEVSCVEELRALPHKCVLNIPMCACGPETNKIATKEEIKRKPHD